ncbi:helix-turn-helix domain-containing protein [Occallatibacter riparius]|uniref:helix-turn-helix domain-containing protein n=1 Tax=Occallatibacter riparius TaxID=1002689 RepID=UPI0036F3CD39
MVDHTEPKLLSVQAFAKSVGLSPWTVRQYAYSGKVSSVKLGRRLMIPVLELDRIIRENLRPARP